MLTFCAVVAHAGINDGLVAYFLFDGNAKDISGNGHDGTVHDAIFTSNRFGQADAACWFDGNGDYIEIPHSPVFDMNTNEFSLSLWLKFGPQPAPYYYGAVFLKAANPSFPYEGFSLFVDYPDNHCEFRLDAREPLHSQTNDLHNNSWRHFVCLKQGSEIKLYVDGIFDHSRAVTHTTSDNSASIILGGNHVVHTAQSYKGVMDDIRLYNRALSPDEIMTLYQYDIPLVAITSTPLTVVYDISAYALAGTGNAAVVGDAWVSNTANGATVSFSAAVQWASPAVPLKVGDNDLIVFCSNVYGQIVSDSITITRGGIGTGAPYVDITNVLAGPVDNTVSTIAIAGTNNLHVAGMMWWTNAANGNAGSLSATAHWQASVPLAVGVNTIMVWGTNLWLLVTNDTLSVIRLPGAPASVTASDGTFSNKVRITFAAATGATKYMIYRALASTPTTFVPLSGELTALGYDDASVAPGQQYYYAVRAGSAYGWSALSAPDSGFALFVMNAGEWKYKAGAKLNKKGKLVGKDVLKGSRVNPPLMPLFIQGWQIGLAGLVNGMLTNWNGPYSLTPNKSQKLWQIKDPAKGTPKMALIKYSVNDKKGDKLDYHLWTNMPTTKVIYILPTNLHFNAHTLTIEDKQPAPPLQFRLQPTGSPDGHGWQNLGATVIDLSKDQNQP
jgi:hypothetical protein